LRRLRSCVVAAIVSWCIVSNGFSQTLPPQATAAGAVDYFFDDPPPQIPVDPGRSSIQRALDWLRNTQVTAAQEAAFHQQDWAGNWPQYLFPELVPEIRFRDVSPFVPLFVHHSLALANEQNAEALELTAGDVQAARLTRQRAMQFLERFRSQPPRPDAGAYRFWPYADDPARLEQRIVLGWLIQIFFGGDFFHGDCAPINIWMFPPGYLNPADADTTANSYDALLTAMEHDGGPIPAGDPVGLFERWRDLGQEPMRVELPWMPNPSGAYLTWIADRGPFEFRTPQDVDLVVNGNVLFCLGRFGRLDAAGAGEAAALIHQAVAEGIHRDVLQVSHYYPDTLVFHYTVSRAFHEGGVESLGPAVQILADELEAEAELQPSGSVRWNRGDPALNTAFAVLTLLNAGRFGSLTEGGAQYLRETQHPVYGHWPEAPFFLGRSARGLTILWGSSAVTTAMAAEALMRVQLEQAPARAGE
jgi:hypothetical protein